MRTAADQRQKKKQRGGDRDAAHAVPLDKNGATDENFVYRPSQ